MAANLPPPNFNSEFSSHEWQDWFYLLWTRTKGLPSFLFTSLDFTGSNIAYIQTRNHNDLTNIQGGGTGDRYHLSAAEYSVFAGSLSIVSKTANYTATTTDNTIMGDTTSGAFTITLPTALGQSGKEYNLKKIGGTALLTIACNGAQTIDGQATILIAIINDSLLVKSDGVNWRIL